MHTVRIRMNENAGVIGEDRTDWLGGEVHTCSVQFAHTLVVRRLAVILGPPEAQLATPAFTHADPVLEQRDPALDTADDAALVKPAAPRKGRR